MPFILWFLAVLGTLVGLMSALVCYAACAVGGMADERSDMHADNAYDPAGRGYGPVRTARQVDSCCKPAGSGARSLPRRATVRLLTDGKQ